MLARPPSSSNHNFSFQRNLSLAPSSPCGVARDDPLMPADDEPQQRKSLYARFRDFSIGDLFERKRVPGPPRSIFVNQPLPQEYYDPKKPHKVLKQYRYTPNQVITSKYTILTFIPRDLLEQFRRVANM